MKKSNYFIAAIVLGMLSSCGNNAQTDSKDLADSVNEAKVDSVESDTAQLSAIAVGEEDAEFATDAADGGLLEVELGTLTQTKALDAKVKEFGKMMVDDHSKINEELKTLAQSKKITLPTTLSKDKQQLKDDLSKKIGKDFDKAYVDLMIKDHKNDVKEFEEAMNKVKDPDVKAFIVKTLPTLKAHLGHIEGIEKQRK
ncbi:DUF4142 domain-containing protein [Pedobacter sp. UC225_65]|uniref:DUF4142 domain-containing protein n=1 Tax=Pedobacter sp. UC225_65 TaxID=3350173 RepID=UPI00366E600F